MAPKSTAPRTAAKKTKQASAPAGLQLSAAQWQAYSAAYSAAASAGFRRLAIQNGAAQLRQNRLKAAATLQKITAVSHQKARTAAIAAFAVSQTYRQSLLAHQNVALQQRIFADYERHILLAGRLQFVYKGEKVYAHTAVMRTLTSAQALTAEQALFNNAAKTAKTAIRSATPRGKTSPRNSAQVAAIQANAKTAALAAARATPKGRTAPRPAKLGPLCNPRSVGLFGNPKGYDCVAAAIATHLSFTTGYDLSDTEYEYLVLTLGPAPAIEDALRTVHELPPPWAEEAPRLVHYEPVVPAHGTRLVAGFATEKGPHAALLMSDLLIASWGELLPLEAVMLPGTGIEEAWNLVWKRGRS